MRALVENSPYATATPDGLRYVRYATPLRLTVLCDINPYAEATVWPTTRFNWAFWLPTPLDLRTHLFLHGYL